LKSSFSSRNKNNQFLIRLATVLGKELIDKTLTLLHPDNAKFLAISSEEGDGMLFIYGVKFFLS
jgi:hypothetical protein